MVVLKGGGEAAIIDSQVVTDSIDLDLANATKVNKYKVPVLMKMIKRMHAVNEVK